MGSKFQQIPSPDAEIAAAIGVSKSAAKNIYDRATAKVHRLKHPGEADSLSARARNVLKNSGIAMGDDRSAVHAVLPEIIANRNSYRCKNMGIKTLMEIVNWLKDGGFDTYGFPTKRLGKHCPHCGKPL